MDARYDNGIYLRQDPFVRLGCIKEVELQVLRSAGQIHLTVPRILLDIYADSSAQQKHSKTVKNFIFFKKGEKP